MPTSLRTPVVRPGGEVGGDAAFRPAEQVVRQSDRRHWRDARRERADDPAHLREAEAAVIDPERAEGEHEVHELPAAMQEPAQVTPGGAMPEIDLDLLDGQARPHRVHGHPGLGTGEPEREREHPAARSRRQRALAGDRLARLQAAGRANQRPRRPLDDPEPAALPLGKRGDREVGVALEQRPEVAGEVGVAEQQRPGERQPARPCVRACPLPRRGRRRTRAPAASARAAVSSRDPSSATITSAAGNLFLSVATVAAIARSSSRAATRIATGSATRLGR